ncbi:MAG TPA: ABC transporter substrate-binding protein [Candidatus Dormibacteraeota bacterium]|nr:ABC transporter substrate-binding protein [Candidatus Dormibacteraeota bacterium]
MRRLIAVAVVLVAACSGAAQTPSGPPNATLDAQTSIGPGEGILDLITWEGYTEDAWVNAFTKTTGCLVRPHYAASSAEMVQLMSDGGGGVWDLVSPPGDVSLELVYSGEVRPINTALIPSWTDFPAFFQNAPYNTVGSVHYGISLQWSPNTLLYNTKKVTPAPTSWSVLYDASHKGQVTVPDNPMQIADAALYQGARDPFELSRKQFTAAVALLTQQHELVKRYWPIAQDEISLFQDGSVVVGSGGPYQAQQLQSVGIPIAETVPTEGATAWGDSWMLAAKAPHPNCAYRWIEYTSEAQVQAQQALYFGETPVNPKACAAMNALQGGSCAKYHADATPAYMTSISFWKTPLAACGAATCVPYRDWVVAWNALKNQ